MRSVELPCPQEGHQPRGWSPVGPTGAAALWAALALSASPGARIPSAPFASPAAPAPSAAPAARASSAAPGRPAAPAPAAADTSEILQEARVRQREFERFRRRRLPWTWGRGGPPCDERIGRFCLRMGGDDEEPWEGPPEGEEVREARGRLLAHIDSARRAAPGSLWLADQRVRYLLEAGRLETALAEARRCAAGPAPCATLLGFVRHHRGEFVRANRAFDRAVAEMPREEGCRWTELDALYRDEPAGGYADAGCAERRAVERRIWPLADPLWLVAGNDRRSAQMARRVRDRMQEGGAASAFGEPWGRDLREILLRYGWPVGFEQAHPGVYDATAHRPAVAHYPHWGMRYMPPAGAVGSAGEPAGGRRRGWRLEEWDLDPPRPRSEYAPAYLREETGDLEHQTARFRRPDSALLVAAWSWPADGGADSVRDGLFLYRGPGVPLIRGGAPPLRGGAPDAPPPACASGAARTVLTARAPAGAGDPVVLGVEALAPGEGRAARARYATRLRALPGAGIALSDLLLLAPAGDTVPPALGRASRCARASGRIRPGARLGLYWEVYPPEAAAALATELSVTGTGGGLFRSIGEFLGLAGERSPLVAAGWRERVTPAEGVHRRSLVVRIPADAEAGRYELRIRVGRPDGGAAEAVRRIDIRTP